MAKVDWLDLFVRLEERRNLLQRYLIIEPQRLHQTAAQGMPVMCDCGHSSRVHDGGGCKFVIPAGALGHGGGPGAHACPCRIPAHAPEDEIIHACPPDGQAVTPCCGHAPFEIPRWHRMTLDPALVTCGTVLVAVG